MTRGLLNLLTATSLLLSVAVGALWVRSYWVSDGLIVTSGFGEHGAQAVSGIWVLVGTNVPYRSTTLRWDQFDSRDMSVWYDPSPPTLPNRLGFGYRYRGGPAADARAWLPGAAATLPPVVWTRMVLAPLWLPAMLLALLPAAHLYRRFRPRYAAGRCAACGYDLRATPGRCPECGTIATSEPAA